MAESFYPEYITTQRVIAGHHALVVDFYTKESDVIIAQEKCDIYGLPNQKWRECKVAIGNRKQYPQVSRLLRSLIDIPRANQCFLEIPRRRQKTIKYTRIQEKVREALLFSDYSDVNRLPMINNRYTARMHCCAPTGEMCSHLAGG